MSKSGKKKSVPPPEFKAEPTAPQGDSSGNYLRTLRLSKGLSIKDVSEETRISESNLNAIEDQNFTALPANTFTRGLVNIYATYLGADAGTIVNRFMVEREEKAPQKRKIKSKQSREILTPKRLAEPTHISSMTMAGILLLLIVATFTGYCIYTSWNPFSFLIEGSGSIQSSMKRVFSDDAPPPVPPAREEIIIVPAEQSLPGTVTEQVPPDTSAAEGESIPPATAENQGEDTADQEFVTADQEYTVSLLFLKDTEIGLAIDDNETESLEFSAGDTRTWTVSASVTLTFSQPDSAEIRVNDSPVPFPVSREGGHTIRIPQDLAEPVSDE